MTYIPSVISGTNLGGLQAALAATYESRVFTLSRVLVPTARFAADTSVTLTDGSISIWGGNQNIPKSSAAYLANANNVLHLSAANGNTDPVSGKPLIVRTKRDEFTGEILDYGVFNADGTIPGTDNIKDITDPGANDDNGDNLDPFGDFARYKINKDTGEIYVNNAQGLGDLANPDSFIDSDTDGNFDVLRTDPTAFQGLNFVVGIVEFDALQGGALSAVQQHAAELSTVIQSLTSTLRSVNDSRKSVFSLIR